MQIVVKKIADFWKLYPWIAVALFIGAMALFLIFNSVRPLFAVIALAAINGILKFYKSTREIPFDFVPSLFFSLTITYVLGLRWAVLFLLLGLIVPSILSGAIKPISVIWWLELFGLNLISLYFGTLPIMALGLILTAIEGLVSFIVYNVFYEHMAEFIPLTLLALLINATYFIVAGKFLESFLGVFV